MRIIWCTYDFGEYSVRQAAALAKDHDVLLAIPSCEMEPHRNLLQSLPGSSQLELFEFDKPRLRQPVRQYLTIRKLLARFEAFTPDVLHFQQGHLWFNAALRWAKQLCPLVVTIHDPRHHAGDAVSKKTPQFVLDYGFRQGDQVIVHGQHLVGEVIKHLGVDPKRIHVIPHVAMGGTAKSSNASEDPNLVLFFGRIWDYKGLEYLIRAQPMISDQLPDARFLIAGEGDDFEKYRRMMADPSKFLVHNSWIANEQRAEFFQRSALVVLPYIEATQSGVVPVASTFRKPVIATNVGALPECIDHNVTGLLVEPRDVRGLADAIIDLLKDSPRRHAMGAAALEKVNRESSASAIAHSTEEVYRLALPESQPPREKGFAQGLADDPPEPTTTPSNNIPVSISK